jgi:RHS repeat-associated protein
MPSRWYQRLSRPLLPARPRPARPRLERLEERLAPSVSVNLVLSSSSTQGAVSSLAIQYSNTGPTAVPAPLLVVSADKADLWLPGDPSAAGPSLQVLGTSPTGPAGTLAPGAGGSIVVDYTPTTTTANDPIHFNVGQVTPGQTINWSAQQSSMRPSTMTTAGWDAVFANFTANVGDTTDSYQAALDADATYLAQVGEPTNDVARLLAYEIDKADDVYSAPATTSNIDASLPAPGLALTFERSFLPTVSGRNQPGTMGLGWTSNWAVTASTDAQGNVTIDEGGTFRSFAKQSDGSYEGNLGDYGVLTALSGGGCQLTESDGSLTAFNANGTLNYVQDSNGNRITAAYSGGLLTQLTDSNGEYLTLSYTNGLLTKLTDSAGGVSTYSYDPTGNYLLSYSDEFGTTTYTYVTGQATPGDNALASVAYADGSHAYFAYDAQGRLTDEHQDNGQQDVKFSYPTGGITSTDADGDTTTVLLDDSGNVVQTTDGLGNLTSYTYDGSGDLTHVQGPQSETYSYTYDAAGNLLSETDPLGLTTSFSYNANNDLTSSTDPKGNTTSYAYDGSNDLLSVTYADGTQEAWNNYDPQGEAAQFVDANGNATGYSYNAQGLLTKATFADGSSYTYTYDTRGNMLTAAGAAGKIQFAYQDSSNPDLLTEVLYPNGQYLKFSYDTIGQRTQSVDQTGYTTNYTYDALGRLSELTDGGGNLIVRYTYDAAGNLVQKDNGNGTRTVYTYDAAGDVLSVVNLAPDHATVNSFDSCTYDALGDVLTDTNQDGGWVYTYDADNQLVHAAFTPNSTDPDGLASQNLTYAYDAAGNRTSETVNGVTTTYAANAVNEYTSSTTNGVTTAYQYDKDGNLTSQTTAGSTTTYAYNLLRELTGVSGPGLTASYTYDPLGNRNGKTVNGATTQFLIDPAGPGGVASAYAAGGLIAHYTYGLGLTSQVSAAGASAYYDFDPNGNTAGVTNAAGAYVNRYTYLPFGQTTAVAAALANAFTLAGQVGVMQDAANLFDMGAREYSPLTGQFSSNDPAGLAGGDLNVRRYVGNNPVNYADPSGLGKGKIIAWILEQTASGAFKRVAPIFTKQGVRQAIEDGLEVSAKDSKYYVNKASEIHTPRRGEQQLWHRHGSRAAGGHLFDSLKGVATLVTAKYFFEAAWPNNAYASGAGEVVDFFNPLSIPNDILDIIDAVGKLLPGSPPSGSSGTTSNTQPGAGSGGGAPTEGVATQIEVGEWEGPGAPSATTVFNVVDPSSLAGLTVTTTDTFDEQSPENYLIYATVVFPEAGEYGVTTTVNGNDVVEDPGHEAVLVYDAPVDVNPVNFTVPAGGTYDGPVATAQDTNPYGDGQINTTIDSGPYGSTTVIPSGGESFTVDGDLNFANYAPGTYSVYVGVWDGETPFNPQGGGVVVDTVTVTAPGEPDYATSVSAQLLQSNGSAAAAGDLAVIDTTDPSITSASQVTASTGGSAGGDIIPDDATNGPVLVTGVTLTNLAGGVKQIAVQGIVNPTAPGSGPTTEPLTIDVGNEAPLSAQVGVDSTNSDYTVNPVPVTAGAGQPVRNVQVATVSGPAGGAYSATINWGDGDTSTGRVTPLGGGLFSVSGTKPHPYAQTGPDAVTVTVTGPGSIPAPPTTSPAEVTPPVSTPSGAVSSAMPVFTWPAVTGAARYELYLLDQTTGQNPALVVPNLTGTTYQLTAAQALTPGHSYTWYLGVVGASGQPTFGNGTSLWVAPLSAPTPTGPSGSIAAAAGYDTPTLTWDDVPGANHYLVYVQDDTTGAAAFNLASVAGTAASYTAAAGLTPGHRFTWYVAAVTADGSEVVWSAPQGFTLAPLPAPTPTDESGAVAAAAGYDTPTFTWDAVTGANHYYVFVQDATTGAVVVNDANVSGTSFPSPALTPGDRFAWYVGAMPANGAINVAASFTLTYFTLAQLPAPTPTDESGNIPASAGYDTPTLTWDAAAGASRYYVFLEDATTNTILVNDSNVTGTSYKVTAALTPGDRFTWYVGSMGAAGVVNLAAFTQTSFTLAPLPAPTPTDESGSIPASAGYDTPTLTWDAAAGASRYYVFLEDATTNTILVNDSNVTGTSYKVTAALTPGDRFTWYVGSMGAAGVVNLAAFTQTSFTLAQLAAPAASGPSGSVGANYPLTYTWGAVAGASRYYVFLEDATTNTIVVNDPTVAGLSFMVTGGLTPGDSFTWYVGSMGAAGVVNLAAFSGPHRFTLA